jgi:carbon-monoxide dehydrogenase medium subunit
MIPAPFDYVRATSAEHILELMAQHGDEAKLLAGGHSLLPMMKVRLASPTVLIDIAAIPELSYVRVDGDDLVIGATTSHATVANSDLIKADAPLLSYAAAQIGDPQIRHRGTIGGSLAHSDPAADLPMTLVALDGTFELLGPSGTRAVKAEDFFIGYFETALEHDEIISAVRVPRRPGVGWGYEKFTRRANDWAIVGIATVAGRVAMANMGSIPARPVATEQALAAGQGITEAAALAADGIEPAGDMHATTAYRQHLARVLTRRALETAASSNHA